MNIDVSFWNQKKILITGHSGFKGVWLSVILKSFGANVYGISKKELYSEFYKYSNSKEIFNEEYFIDLGNPKPTELQDILRNNRFDLVFHLAAQSLVPEAYQNPLETLKVNILGTYYFLMSCVENMTTKSIIVSTTDKVYKNPSLYNNEESSLGGHEFYSSSKVSQEMIIEAFKTYDKKINISIVRSGNVLGPGDGAKGRIVTDIMRALKSGKEIQLRQPLSIRPWQDILDSLQGYILVAQKNYSQNESSIYNLNSELNNEINVKEIAEKFISNWGGKTKVIELENKEFYESKELRLDSSKAIKELGWKPSVEIDEIVEKICNWERAETNELKFDLIQDQIKNYFYI